MRFGDLKETKHYIQIRDKSLKKALIMKNSMQLEDADKKYGVMRKFSLEEVKKRHMGKMKCIVKYKDDEEVIKILELYYS